MPVRIYDIAKKLGIESKEVLAKAKALGIAGAKVPSSSLDKITAEYLEEQLGGRKPVAFAELPPKPAPAMPPAKPTGRQAIPAFSHRPAGKAPAPISTAPAAPKFVPPTTGELISLKPPIIVRDLAERLNKKPFQLIADLMEL